MINSIMNFVRDEQGASAIEYGLLVGLIAVVLITTLGLLGQGLDGLFTDVEQALPAGGAP